MGSAGHCLSALPAHFILSRSWGGEFPPSHTLLPTCSCDVDPPDSLQAFISVVLSKLALLGAAACFVLSGVGLTNGPLCFYNTTELGLRHGALWGYPFLDAIDQGPQARADSYLYNQRTWSICLEPEGIVSWHVVLFSLLLLLSVAEMVLALLQILNGCLGCLCGFCEGK
uniref:Transmembrane 4 L six family member 19 n=1 Tax=Ficedula albicollis TaxID=59894 RepID=A0A803V4K5_FICAL